MLLQLLFVLVAIIVGARLGMKNTLPNTTTTHQDMEDAVAILKSYRLAAINGAAEDYGENKHEKPMEQRKSMEMVFPTVPDKRLQLYER